jgi:membrane protein DedA with SNARE-associated domain
VVELISIYGVWLVAALIAIESIGLPVPAEASLMAAAFFAARTHEVNISLLLAIGAGAGIAGEVAGFWIGRKFGSRLLLKFGARLGLKADHIELGGAMFRRYGGRFVFAARFLPIFRNTAAVLAGTSAMAQHNFYFASATAAIAWVICYGFGSYSLGMAFAHVASMAAVAFGLVTLLIIVAVPAFILQRKLIAVRSTQPR